MGKYWNTVGTQEGDEYSRIHRNAMSEHRTGPGTRIGTGTGTGTKL